MADDPLCTNEDRKAESKEPQPKVPSALQNAKAPTFLATKIAGAMLKKVENYVAPLATCRIVTAFFVTVDL